MCIRDRQHRGQESCGIAVSDTRGPKGIVKSHKGMGLVNEVFTPEVLTGLKGDIGLGHTRYSTAGSSTRENEMCIRDRITGAQLDEISDEEFNSRIEEFSVYARVQPEHKVRIVKGWKSKGMITAMTGDLSLIHI